MKFDVLSRSTGKVQFTADIDCEDSAAKSMKVGLAAMWALRHGASLRDADLRGANLWGADLRYAKLQDANLRDADLRYAKLRGANLRGVDLAGADLRDADLNGVTGVNDYIKCIQVEQYSITYTATVLQIGCERHDISEWRAFDDKRIVEMDGKSALKFWQKYKKWIFDTISLCPAKPTKKDEQ